MNNLCEKHFKNLKSLSFERRMKETERILLNNNLNKKETILSLQKLLECTFESTLTLLASMNSAFLNH